MENSQIMMQQPKIIEAFKQGFQTVSQRIYLVLFPLLLDLLFLFGPKIKIAKWFETSINTMPLPPLAENLKAQWLLIFEQMKTAAQNYNLLTVLRTKPLGLPSLFSDRIFEDLLIKNNLVVETQTFSQAGLFFALFSLIGIGLTVFFFQSIAHATPIKPEPTVRSKWAKVFLNFLVIPFAFFALLLVLFLPGMFIVSLATVFIPMLGSLLLIGLLMLLISVLIPVVFTPHGIVFNNMTFKSALQQSRHIVRQTRGKSSIFLLLAIGVSFFGNMLWNLPKDGSWMLIVGAVGHALITTIILVASFYFFLDAQKCASQVFEIDIEPDRVAQ